MKLGGRICDCATPNLGSSEVHELRAVGARQSLAVVLRISQVVARMLPTLLAVAFGLLQGIRHAMEPDHLAAVSTLVAEQRSARASVGYAALWGLGHALMLLAVGGAFFLLRTRMPPAMEDAFELGVAIMLVGLGLRGMYLAGRPPPPAHTHGHGPSIGGRLRPLFIGIVHGLAGSGALGALVLAKATSAMAGLAFLAVYGAGAALGMALLAGVAGVPLARLVRSPRGMPALLAVTGLLCVGLGLGWGYPLVARWL